MITDCIITEEYSRFTTGMFGVVLAHASASSNHRILVNYAHWALDDFPCSYGQKVDLYPLGFRRFYLAYRSFLKRLFPAPLRLPYRLLNRAFGLLFLPLEIPYVTAQLLSIPYDSRITFHIGGWPAGFRARFFLLLLLIFSHRKRRISLVIHNFPIRTSSLSIRLTQKIYSFLISIYPIKVVTVSHGAAAALRPFFPSVSVIYNGSSHYSSLLVKPSLNTNSNSSALLSVSGLEKTKMLICTSFHPLKQTGKCITTLHKFADFFDITWLGPIDDSYFSEIFGSSIDPSFIDFRGFSDCVADYISNHHFVFMPALQYESFGMLAIEAAMLSRASLCFSNTPTAELFDHNISGIHCAPTPQALHAQLSTIVRLGKPYLSELGINANIVYQHNYTPQAMYTNLNLLNQ